MTQHTEKVTTGHIGDGKIVEMIYNHNEAETAFVVYENGTWHKVAHVDVGTQRLVPYPATNNLIHNKVILFPTEPLEYDSEAELVREIQAFIHKYVDVSERFEQIASYYVLFSWLYDSFQELPYLRLRGDYGSGKTRFLLTVGSLCYKPIFTSGASTISPLFRILDSIHGTLLIDEGDLRFSDEKADLVKILNHGNVRGIPVLRNDISPKKEYNPRAFDVFGPKIVATRGYYQDTALESRFITEEMGSGGLRRDIPINLPHEAHEEAMVLRNKLLLFRFRNVGKKRIETALVDETIEPRMNQIFVPLMSVISDETLRGELKALARKYNSEVVAERGTTMEATILEAIRDIKKTTSQPSMKEIADRCALLVGDDGASRVTPRAVGAIVRKKLGLVVYKSHGVYVVPSSEDEKLGILYRKYGLAKS